MGRTKKLKVVQVNRSVQVIDTDILKITRNFAEKNLSKACLKYAEESTDTHYYWTFEENAYAVIFEIPAVFKDTYFDINDPNQVQLLAFKLGSVTKSYAKEKGIQKDTFRKTLQENFEKKIEF